VYLGVFKVADFESDISFLLLSLLIIPYHFITNFFIFVFLSFYQILSWIFIKLLILFVLKNPHLTFFASVIFYVLYRLHAHHAINPWVRPKDKVPVTVLSGVANADIRLLHDAIRNKRSVMDRFLPTQTWSLDSLLCLHTSGLKVFLRLHK
jgi:hypothetical protein